MGFARRVFKELTTDVGIAETQAGTVVAVAKLFAKASGFAEACE